jgi:hypothetical protein
MASERPNIKESLKDIERVSGRAGSDTIRLWEGYRDQAFLWRALALLQMPATALAIILSLVLYFTADTIIEVPDMPQPGFYSVKKLPDSHFINFANEIVNLIATYQPATARKQFTTARDYLWEPALTNFETVMMQRELRAIEETRRSQMFYVEDKLIRVERFPDQDYVVVRIPGTRQKLVGTKPILPVDQLAYYVKMTTIPKNVHNEFGIVVVDMRVETVKLEDISATDRREEKAEFKRKELEELKERRKH